MSLQCNMSHNQGKNEINKQTTWSETTNQRKEEDFSAVDQLCEYAAHTLSLVVSCATTPYPHQSLPWLQRPVSMATIDDNNFHVI